ncbi:hypothetical protein JVU11DRAFT_3089 [Chiua virens]|nr:hypothetical protein JVU11DRAFT_3089 [Chiua virens]
MSKTSSIALISTWLLFGATWIYFSPSRRRGRRSTVNSVMIALVVLHILFVISDIMHRPPNLFKRFGIPINAPVDHIRLVLREVIINRMGERDAVVAPPDFPKDVDTLLKRLGVHGSRDIYVRFGQRAMQTCPYCSSATDYAMFVLSGILLDYLRTATLLLLLTTTINGRQRWRTNSLGVLTCAFLAEVYAFTSASAVPLEKDARAAFMWHDNLSLVRELLFVLLPMSIQMMPVIYPPPPVSVTLLSVLERLDRTLPRAKLLKYFHQAVLRYTPTRERAVEFWTNVADEGAIARGNPNVQMTAAKLGFGFATPASSESKGGQESVLRENARMAVRSLKPLFMPPPN